MINWKAYEAAKTKARAEVEDEGVYPLDAGHRVLCAAFTTSDGALDLNAPQDEVMRLCRHMSQDVGLHANDHFAYWLEFVAEEKASRAEA